MSFLQGSDVAAPSNKIFPISGSDYPKGENGFKYDNAYPYPDDVGVVYLDSTVAPAAALHKGTPPLTVASSQQLDFVGFGYALTNGSLNGLGVKRGVRMPLSQLTERTYQYSVLGANTCNGDSGGPAFIGTEAMPILTGVTSYGDAACSSFGVNTRIEAYMDWLEPRLK